LILPIYSSWQIKAADDLVILLQIGSSVMSSNGIEKEIDEGRNTTPVIDNGRTLVPIRAIIEEFGGTVQWNQTAQTVILKYETDEIKLVIDSYTAYLNGETKALDAAPQIINGRTMLPIRFIAESFGFTVYWDDKNAVITITNDSDSETPKTSYVQSDADLKVHFIDVGQGDAIFIELPNSETMLIDAGPESDTAANYIKNQGYSAITYVAATHPDADHISGMPEVLNTFSVDRFYMPEKEHTTQIFENMIDALANNGCESIYAAAGKYIIDTSDLKLYFVGPVKIYSDNNNDCSAVIKLEYKQNSFLFTGDAETDSENDMIAAGYDLSADILKVGHHGSSSSTSAAFVKAVNPKDAVISVGADNKYNHPTAETLAVLNAAGVNIYRTDEQGTIIVTSDGINYTIDSLKSAANTSSEIDSNSPIVYVTKTGSKYHRAGCSYLDDSAYEITLSDAENMGLTPCSRCKPTQ
ncbi:MAG: MBL fold metallo-hydrolase, partial [Clostridiales bacterium]|nr:MBL fold metallo-hydrolase [Clostridiales bacterium]